MKLSTKFFTFFLALLASASTLFAASVFEIAAPLREEPLNLKATTKPFKDMNADNCALLRVESDVAGELFITDVTVYQRDKVSAGVFEFYLSYRERNVTFTSPGYMPFRYKLPMALEKGKAYSVGLKSVSSGGGEGKGGVKIETTPAGASIAFNGIPLPSTTPLSLDNQPVGSHLVKITKSGYRETETTVEIEKDKTIARQFTLNKLTAALKVNSNPEGAKVVLDGDEIGTTPLDRSDLTPGEGTLVVSLKGYETVTRQVRLVADQPKVESVDLFAQTGSVSITCDPIGTEVFLDGISIGEYKGTTLTREKLSLGSHSIVGMAEGYEDASTDFTVEYNKAIPVKLKLNPLPGAIYVTTTPEGADITLDDRPTGKETGAKIEGLSAGEHRLSLSLAGYGGIEKSVTVSPGKTVTVSEAMTITPKIEADSTGLRSGQVVQGPLSGITFVSIPGGSFMMGSNDGDGDEKPVHWVEIEPFAMMTTEVTQKMWQELMDSNPSYFKVNNLPVENVSWNDTQEFLKKLNQHDPGKNYRLPSEAEWEYACRAGTTTNYYSGDSESDLGRVGWCSLNSGSWTHPVGYKSPNAWGLYDMHGNVWEWCEDWYHESYSGAPDDGRAWASSEGASSVLRGGSWLRNPDSCRASNRYWYVTNIRY